MLEDQKTDVEVEVSLLVRLATLKEMISQIYFYLIRLSSKSYVCKDKMTKY